MTPEELKRGRQMQEDLKTHIKALIDNSFVVEVDYLLDPEDVMQEIRIRYREQV